MTRLYRDTVIAVVNPDVDPADDDPEMEAFYWAMLRGRLTGSARHGLLRQNPDGQIHWVDWVLARTAQEVLDWPLPHPCEQCETGRAKTAEAVREGVYSVIALGTVYASEPDEGEVHEYHFEQGTGNDHVDWSQVDD